MWLMAWKANQCLKANVNVNVANEKWLCAAETTEVEKHDSNREMTNPILCVVALLCLTISCVSSVMAIGKLCEKLLKLKLTEKCTWLYLLLSLKYDCVLKLWYSHLCCEMTVWCVCRWPSLKLRWRLRQYGCGAAPMAALTAGYAAGWQLALQPFSPSRS